MKQVVVKPDTQVAITQPITEVGGRDEKLIDIFMVSGSYVERKREEKLRELIKLFEKNSLKKGLEELGGKEVIRRINASLRERGIKVKLREEHLPIIKKLLEEE